MKEKERIYRDENDGYWLRINRDLALAIITARKIGKTKLKVSAINQYLGTDELKETTETLKYEEFVIWLGYASQHQTRIKAASMVFDFIIENYVNNF